MDFKLEPQIEAVFKIWLELNEDQKRDFMKELFYFNNLPPEKKQKIVQSYKKAK